MTQRDLDGVIAWYRNNEVWPGSIGFDPDGMCQKICRTAPNIGPGFASAFAQQQGTPEEDRVHRIRDIRIGMIGLYDDIADDNPFGHVVTYTGRDKKRDPDTLGSLFCRTNSAKANRIIVVRGDYFARHWGDEFQFASRSINGVQLDIADGPRIKKPPIGPKGIARLKHFVAVYDDMIDTQRHKIRMNSDNDRVREQHERIVRALRRDRNKVLTRIEWLKSLEGR